MRKEGRRSCWHEVLNTASCKLCSFASETNSYLCIVVELCDVPDSITHLQNEAISSIDWRPISRPPSKNSSLLSNDYYFLTGVLICIIFVFRKPVIKFYKQRFRKETHPEPAMYEPNNFTCTLGQNKPSEWKEPDRTTTTSDNTP